MRYARPISARPIAARPSFALVLGLAALGACYRGGGGGGALEDRAGTGAAAVAADPLAFLPVDSELVIGFDAQQVRRSALWKQYEPQLLAMMGRGLSDFRAACGYDPFEALRSVTLGGKGGGGAFDGVIVVRGPERDRTLPCAGRAFAGLGKVVVERGVITLSGGAVGEPPVVMAFADATTLVMSGSRPKLEAALVSGAPLRGSRGFSELWPLVDTKQAVWLIANGSADELASLASFGIRPRAVLGSVSLANGLAMTGRVRLGGADEARQLADGVQAQLGAVQGFVEDVRVTAEGADLAISVSMTMAQIEAITRLASGIFGGGGPFGGP